MTTIRVLICDDHPLMRDALRGAIEDEEDLSLVGEARNGFEAVEKAQVLRPDVILMDLMMPGKDGMAAITEILSLNPDAHILTLTSSQEEEKIAAAVEAGVLGYITKDVQREELLYAIREVSQGKAFLPPAITGKLLSGLRKRKQASEDVVVEELTPREHEVLRLIGDGASNREIANLLYLSEGTVRTHVHNILQKLGLQNRNQAILFIVNKKDN